MEKFGNWRDKSSGVGPFLTRVKPESTISLVLRWIFGIIKFPIFIILLFASSFNLLVGYYFPIRFIGRFLERVNSIATYHLLLFLFGQYWTSVIPTPLIKVFLTDTKWEKPSHGEIVFTHLTSYVNLFWLQAKLSPLYIIPTSNGKCVVRGIFSMFWKILLQKDLADGSEMSIADVVTMSKKKRRGPLVVFAEGAPTNGEGILEFSKFSIPSKDCTVHILGFHRVFKGITPNFIAGNGFLHLIKTLGTLKADVIVKVALKKDVPQLSDTTDNEYIEKCRGILSKLMNIPTVEISSKDYKTFIQAFNKAPQAQHSKQE